MASKPQPAAGVSKKVVAVAHKARGRTATKYEFEIIPFFAGELPAGIEHVSFAWERNSKVFVTEAEPVNPHTKAVFWKQYLRQTATVYQESGRYLPKEYTFKVQSVKVDAKGKESRKTIGKIKADLAAFCTNEPSPIPQEVFLQLKPAGKLKVSVKAAWLKDARVDMDAMTELSLSTTHRSNGANGSSTAGDSEQDLSGFEHAVGGHHSRTPSMVSTSAPLAAKPGATGAAGGKSQPQQHQQQQQQEPAGVKDDHSPRIGTGNNAGPRIPGAIPGGFSVPLSPEEEQHLAAEEKAKQAALRQLEYDRMRRTLEDQLRDELATAFEANRGNFWRDTFCCCFPQKQVKIRTATELAAMDDNKGLLSAPGDVI